MSISLDNEEQVETVVLLQKEESSLKKAQQRTAREDMAAPEARRGRL